MFKDRFWIIGHEVDFDNIIFGKNTGSYSKFGKAPYFLPTGNFYYIYNFISQIEGKELIFNIGPCFSKCGFLDKLNKNVKEPERCFDSVADVAEYVQFQAREFIQRAYIKVNSKRILEDFFTEGLFPN